MGHKRKVEDNKRLKKTHSETKTFLVVEFGLMMIKKGTLNVLHRTLLATQSIYANYLIGEFAKQKTNSTIVHTKKYTTIGGNCFNKNLRSYTK